jgi:outer membrane protein assembly factor BamB
MVGVRYPFLSTIVLLAVLFTPPFAAVVHGWEFTVSSGGNVTDQALTVTFRKEKDVLAAGRVNDDPYVVKLDADSGQALWTFTKSGTGGGSESMNAIDLDGSKHVVVAGVTSVTSEAGGGNSGRFTVIKLDKHTGMPHWFVQVGVGAALGVAVDPAGDVLAAGQLDNELGIVKLRGADGVEMWRTLATGGGGQGQARALTMDSAGNAVAAGFIRAESFRAEYAVLKISGTNGKELWRHQVPSHPFSRNDQAIAVSVDSHDDVVAAGVVAVFIPEENRLARDCTVFKLAGTDGAVRWRRAAAPDSPRGLAVDAADDVVVVGGFVVKLSGADGTDAWRRVGDPESADNVAVDSTGDVAVGGVIFVDVEERRSMEGRDPRLGVW